MNNQENSFLDRVRQGFQNYSQAEIIGFFLIFIILITLLVVIIIFKRRSFIRSRRSYAEKSFSSTIKKLSLSIDEESLMKKLSEILPKGDEIKHLLLENAPTFNFAVKKYTEKNKADDNIISSLRFKLGFISWNPGKPLHSTVELPPGLRLNIKPAEGKTFIGKITEQYADHFIIKDISQYNHIIANKSITIIFQRANGIYSIHTEILKSEKDVFYIKHSEKIHLDIHRQYFRKFLSRPIEITKLDRSMATIQTTTFEIGGGGFSFYNKDGKIKENDEIMIVIELPPMLKLRMRGKITKLTHNGTIGHVQFTVINENIRDKIISYLISLKRSE